MSSPPPCERLSVGAAEAGPEMHVKDVVNNCAGIFSNFYHTINIDHNND